LHQNYVILGNTVYQRNKIKMKADRRVFIKKSLQSGLVLAAGMPLLSACGSSGENKEDQLSDTSLLTFKQAALPYAFNALEPHIDALTMEIHYGKHHAAYVNNLNAALEENAISVASIEELMANISKYPMAVRNNGGGHYNHELFWNLMKPGGSEMPGKLAEAINASFGSIDAMKEAFTKAAMSRFGSGWAWLVLSENGKLEIGSTPNQDNPLMDVSELKGRPLLGIDVWEHAYYLKYQNLRAQYIENWWNLVDFEAVAARMG
jgi:superoxide dismutase, Fe-Mn family